LFITAGMRRRRTGTISARRPQARPSVRSWQQGRISSPARTLSFPATAGVLASKALRWAWICLLVRCPVVLRKLGAALAIKGRARGLNWSGRAPQGVPPSSKRCFSKPNLPFSEQEYAERMMRTGASRPGWGSTVGGGCAGCSSLGTRKGADTVIQRHRWLVLNDLRGTRLSVGSGSKPRG
jgi:hypothetical protein